MGETGDREVRTSRIFNCKVEFVILDTTLKPFLFTNNHVNKPSDISV
jgi:hypothetical protein